MAFLPNTTTIPPSASGASFVGTSSNLTRGDGSAGAVPAGNFANMTYSDVLAALGAGKWPVFNLASVGGTANAITATVTGLTLTSGQFFWLVPASSSSSTTVNLNLNSGGNVRVKKADGSTDPASGDLQAGVIALLYYDGTNYRQMTGMPVSATNRSKLVGSFGKSGDQSISAATPTDVTYDVHTIAPTAEITHSTSSNPAQTTANGTGGHTVAGTFQFIPTSTGVDADITLELKVNGTTVTDGTWTFNAYKNSGANYMWPVLAELSFSLTANDVVKFVFTSSAAGALKSTFRIWTEY